MKTGTSFGIIGICLCIAVSTQSAAENLHATIKNAVSNLDNQTLSAREIQGISAVTTGWAEVSAQVEGVIADIAPFSFEVLQKGAPRFQKNLDRLKLYLVKPLSAEAIKQFEGNYEAYKKEHPNQSSVPLSAFMETQIAGAALSGLVLEKNEKGKDSVGKDSYCFLFFCGLQPEQKEN